jgi:hypothetical protein
MLATRDKMFAGSWSRWCLLAIESVPAVLNNAYFASSVEIEVEVTLRLTVS